MYRNLGIYSLIYFGGRKKFKKLFSGLFLSVKTRFNKPKMGKICKEKKNVLCLF